MAKIITNHVEIRQWKESRDNVLRAAGLSRRESHGDKPRGSLVERA